MSINLIACMARNRAIGRGNQLLYHIEEDMRHFKNLTWGHTVVMGHKTFCSLPNGSLPNRRNVVITHNKSLSLAGCEVVNSLADALQIDDTLPYPQQEFFVIGGASIYNQVLNLQAVENIYLTVIDDIPCDADAFFPKFDEKKWEVRSLGKGIQGHLAYEFLHYSKS